MSLTAIKSISLLMASIFALASCASPNHLAAQSPRLTFADLNHGDRQAALENLGHPPYVIGFKAGDHIPFSLVVESKLFETDVPPLTIVVKRDFYLLFRKDGPPLLSEDGVDFQARAKNGFMFGFEMKKGESTKVVTRISLRAE